VTLFIFLLTIILAGFITKLVLIYPLGDDDDGLADTLAPVAADAGPAPTDDPAALDSWFDALLDRTLAPTRASLFALDLPHFLLGFALVGLVGAFSVAYYLTFSPFNFGRLGVGGGGGGRRRGSDGVGALILGALIVVGAARMAFFTYRMAVISHVHADHDLATAVAARLASGGSGLRLWLNQDPDGFDPLFGEAAHDARALVALVSHAYARSDECAIERAFFERHLARPVVPVRIETDAMVPGLEAEYIDFTPSVRESPRDSEAALRALADRLQRVGAV
ncbi:hypothetical protein HK405_011021, partial [Cladochytrium tenue]